MADNGSTRAQGQGLLPLHTRRVQSLGGKRREGFAGQSAGKERQRRLNFQGVEWGQLGVYCFDSMYSRPSRKFPLSVWSSTFRNRRV